MRAEGDWNLSTSCAGGGRLEFVNGERVRDQRESSPLGVNVGVDGERVRDQRESSPLEQVHWSGFPFPRVVLASGPAHHLESKKLPVAGESKSQSKNLAQDAVENGVSEPPRKLEELSMSWSWSPRGNMLSVGTDKVMWSVGAGVCPRAICGRREAGICQRAMREEREFGK